MVLQYLCLEPSWELRTRTKKWVTSSCGNIYKGLSLNSGVVTTYSYNVEQLANAKLKSQCQMQRKRFTFRLAVSLVH